MDSTCSCTKPIVKVLQGSLQGCIGHNYIGERYYKFLGIPFAKPPVGDLRFKAPVPAESWSGIRDAANEGSRCYSRDERTMEPVGSEDCLYLNVYTKQLPQITNLKPVMVWIYGGAFVSGTSSPELYGPEFLLIEDVVVVALNYRLGIYGFLSLKDATLDIPGNAGLKDQCLALKWVKDNIKNFGGDPENVTIFGESAGATSVHYHVISQRSKGLFHKAIIQSGTTLNCWAVSDHDATKIVEELDATASNEKEALEILKRTSKEKLFEIQESYSRKQYNPSKLSFAPTIESSSARDPFISKIPLEIIKSGDYNHVPLIFGYNNSEGMLFECLKKFDVAYLVGDTDLVLEDVIPWHLEIDKQSDLSKDIVKKLEDFYFKSEDTDEAFRLLLSDQAIVIGTIASVRQHAKTMSAPVYLYRMALETSLNFSKKICDMEHIPGVCHADELGYLFKSYVTPTEIVPGSIEDISLRRFVKLWASFAKLGRFDAEDTGFNIEWKPVTQDETHFLKIDKEFSTDINPDNERVNFWKEIYDLSDGPHVINYL